MMTTITGGKNRYVAEVDDTNSLKVRSVTDTIVTEAIFAGNAYALVIPEITLTNATPTAIFTYTNDEDKDLIVFSNSLNISDSTGGTSDTVAISVDNGINISMTGGSGSKVQQQNLIIGQQGELDNFSETGLINASIDGASGLNRYIKTGASSEIDIVGVVPKGASFAVTVTPPAGNTSMIVSALIYCYLQRDNA